MDTRITPTIAALLAFTASIGEAQGHAGAPPDTLDMILHDEAPEGLSLEATFGLLLSDDTVSWRWLCHETIARPGAFLTPSYTRNASGVLLATIGVLQQGQAGDESLYRSTDACDWAPVVGLTNDVVSAVTFDPTDENVALAGTAGVTVGALNGIHRSSDGGATFSSTSASDLESRIFRTIEISPAGSDAGGSTGWATSSWFGPLGAWIHRSTDGGITWEEHEQSLTDGDETQILLDVAAVHSTDPATAWIRVDGQLADRLMMTTDGGATLVELFRVESDIRDVLREPDGTLWVATVDAGLYRAADGTTFTEVADAPLVNAMAHDARGVHLALSGGINDDVMVRTQDGASFETTMVWGDLVGPVECPEDSDAWTFCDPNWEIVEVALGRVGDDDDSAGDDDDSADPDAEGCCPEGANISGADTVGPALFLTFVASLRRRRPRPIS